MIRRAIDVLPRQRFGCEKIAAGRRGAKSDKAIVAPEKILRGSGDIERDGAHLAGEGYGMGKRRDAIAA